MRITLEHIPAKDLVKSLNSEIESGVILRNASLKTFRYY